MGSVKRAGSLVVSVVLMLAVAACNGMPIETIKPTIVMASPVTTVTPTESPVVPTSAPTPLLSPTIQENTSTPEPEETALDSEEPVGEPEETEEPEPIQQIDIPDIKYAGLTSEQFYKLKVLLLGTLYMGEFSNGKKLSAKQYLGFVWDFLDNYPELNGYNEPRESYTKSEIKRIVKSAFGFSYRAKQGHGSGPYSEYTTGIYYRNGKFEYIAGEGDPYRVPYVYRIIKMDDDQLKVTFDVFNEGGGLCIQEYDTKRQVILKKDKNSMFGYYIVSLSNPRTKPSFTSAQASSVLPGVKGISYKPQNAIDGKISTGWATKKAIGEWINISSAKTQSVSGMSFYIGDRSQYPDEGDVDNPESGKIRVKLEFSDHTSIMCDIAYDVYDKEEEISISFGREIKTKFIKITVVSTSARGIYIAELKPF